jgi:hypothetical protein
MLKHRPPRKAKAPTVQPQQQQQATNKQKAIRAYPLAILAQGFEDPHIFKPTHPPKGTPF